MKVGTPAELFSWPCLQPLLSYYEVHAARTASAHVVASDFWKIYCRQQHESCKTFFLSLVFLKMTVKSAIGDEPVD